MRPDPTHRGPRRRAGTALAACAATVLLGALVATPVSADPAATDAPGPAAEPRSDQPTDTARPAAETAPSTAATSATATSTTVPSATAPSATAPPPATPDRQGGTAADTAAAADTSAAAETGEATGPDGQVLRVTPATGLDPAGAALTVTGEGYDELVGVYVGLCVDNGALAAPGPCLGGVDMEGDGGASAWVSSNPPPYAVGLTEPYGPGGTFTVDLLVPAADELTDCLDGVTRCVLATRADHTNSSNRTADVRVPVTFAGQEAEVPETPPATGSIQLDAATVAAGGAVTVSGTGFAPGEQVQVWLLSEPLLVGVVAAGPDGAVRSQVTIPATTAPGVHHLELRGMTSGLVVTSADLVVTAAVAAAPVTPAPQATPRAPVATTTGGTLPATGTSTLPLATAGGGLLLAGCACVRIADRRSRATTLRAPR